MALHYLSGDSVGASKKKRKEKKQPKQKKTKQEKKAGRKKKVAKVTLAAARGSFLAALDLNLAKSATKLARIYKKPNGPAKLRRFWEKFGGDFEKLKKAIAKGSKQQISGEAIGVAAATVLAAATPVLIALVPLIKEFGAGGDAKESSEFDQSIQDGKNTLASDPEFDKTVVTMPEDKDVGLVQPPAEQPTAASFASPLGMCFKGMFITGFIGNSFADYPILLFIIGIISLYFFIGFVFIMPFYMYGKSWAEKYFSVPVQWIMSPFKRLSWARK